ncbi:hypothetical protein EMIT0373P_10175 [Pseudomonas chlororaphis]
MRECGLKNIPATGILIYPIKIN